MHYFEWTIISFIKICSKFFLYSATLSYYLTNSSHATDASWWLVTWTLPGSAGLVPGALTRAREVQSGLQFSAPAVCQNCLASSLKKQRPTLHLHEPVLLFAGTRICWYKVYKGHLIVQPSLRNTVFRNRGVSFWRTGIYLSFEGYILVSAKICTKIYTDQGFTRKQKQYDIYSYTHLCVHICRYVCVYLCVWVCVYLYLLSTHGTERKSFIKEFTSKTWLLRLWGLIHRVSGRKGRLESLRQGLALQSVGGIFLREASVFLLWSFSWLAESHPYHWE